MTSLTLTHVFGVSFGESERHLVSLFLGEIGTSFTLNRVVLHMAICKSGMVNKTRGFHSFTLRVHPLMVGGGYWV